MAESDLRDCFTKFDLWACAGVIPWGRIIKLIRSAGKVFNAVRKALKWEDRIADARAKMQRWRSRADELVRQGMKKLDDLLKEERKRDLPDKDGGAPPGGGGAEAAAGATCSFSGDTAVLMADGSTRPLSDIKVGDQVMATDPETGEQGPRTVTGVWVHEDTVIDLNTEGGTTVTTTEDHPFWNATDKAWQRADQLDAGDSLITASGERAAVTGLLAGTARVAIAYNLTVSDIHTYHVMVGGRSILVHNRCPEFVPGQSYDHVFETEIGPVNFSADVEDHGTTLTLSNISVFPQRRVSTWKELEATRGSLGPREVMRHLNELREQAGAQGYTHLRIIGERVTGGNLGHMFDKVWPTIRRR